MEFARIVRWRRAVLAAAVLPSSLLVACSSSLRATAASVSADRGALLRATQASTSATSVGGSARCLVLNPHRVSARRMLRLVRTAASLGQHRRRSCRHRPRDVLPVLGRGLLPLHVHVGAGEFIPRGVVPMPVPRPAACR